MKDKMKPDYGNWVPTKLLALLYVASLTIAVLLFISILCKWIIPVTIVLAVLLCISLFFSCYMTAFHHAFSFSGGRMMGKVHEFVISRLPWDGRDGKENKDYRIVVADNLRICLPFYYRHSPHVLGEGYRHCQ